MSISEINVINVGDPWKATPTSDPLYTIHIEGVGEPQKTFSSELAVLGTHQAESYQAKSGKTYWRVPKANKSYPSKFNDSKQFKADPDSRESIEWQKSYALATEVTRDYFTFKPDDFPKDLEDYTKAIDRVAVHIKNVINVKPTSVQEEEFTSEDQGDFAKILPEVELPPVDQLEPPF